MPATFTPVATDEAIAQERETASLMTKRERGLTWAEYAEKQARAAAFYAKFGPSRIAS